MTKKEEIAALIAFAKSLPADTYLRPWLEEILPEIQQEITSDFLPSPSIRDSRRRAEAQAQDILLEATVKAERIVKDATDQALSLKRQAGSFRDRVLSSLYQSTKELQSV